ncbi:OmpA family protein [bacterium]|nr:OmpA family protein [bacterium]
MIKYRVALFALCIVSLVVFFSLSSVKAADCDALRANARKERSLIKKKALLESAVTLCPDDPLINYDYAYLMERLRKYDKALKYYVIASKVDSKFSKAFFGMADIYMVRSEIKNAIQSYKQGLKGDDSDNSRAKTSLELAQIKFKTQSGAAITSEDFIKVMVESKAKSSVEGGVDGPVLRMQILFYIASSTLTSRAKQDLAIVGTALLDKALIDVKFEIAGHTDGIGDPESNMKLSKLRAEAVRSYLIENYKIIPERLVVAYYGESKPVVPNSDKGNQGINRRVEFKRLD